MSNDSNANLISWQSDNWNSSQWVIYFSYSAIYDNNNHLLSELYENLDGTHWRNNQKMTYTYDSNSNLNSSLFEVWLGYILLIQQLLLNIIFLINHLSC